MGVTGLGTTTPSAPLHVVESYAGTTSPQVIIQNSNTGAGTYTAGLNFYNYTGSGNAYSGRIYGVFDANAFGSARLTLAAPTTDGDSTLYDVLNLKGGKVAVGTIAPESRLQSWSAAGAGGPQFIVSTGTAHMFEVNGTSTVFRNEIWMIGTSSVTGKLVGLNTGNQVYAVYAP